jgi:hypothetical protein
MVVEYKFLIPQFLQAMDDIGRYGDEKYSKDSFNQRALVGDRSRGTLSRCEPIEIACHAHDHFQDYLQGVKHDKFGTLKHQLAAVAFNAMMEFYFAGLSHDDGE